MNEWEFDRLIEKYQHELLSGRTKAVLDDWYSEMGRTKEVEMLWPVQEQDIIKKKIKQHIKGDKGEKNTHTLTTLLRIAAAIIVVAIASYSVWYYNAAALAPDAVTKVMLHDGSIVWLKGNSKLTYPKNFSGSVREVTLHGEGLFEVAKDARHPFIIHCGALTAKVLGTSFNIKSETKNIEVIVLTGKVALSAHNQKEVFLTPQQRAVYNVEKKQITPVIQAPVTETKLLTAGTEYSMRFEDTPMHEVIRRIEGKFNVTISILANKKELGNCMITVDLTDQSLDKTLNLIAQTLSFRYTINGTTVTIDGGGCDAHL